MRNTFIPLNMLAILCLWTVGFAVRAEDKTEAKKEEAEKKEAQAEEAADRDNLGSGKQTTYAGKLELEPLDEAAKTPPKTYGNFYVTKGTTYPIKLSDPALYKVLLPYNGKTISVLAKPRNQGTYLLITGLVSTEGPAKAVSKRGGF